MTDLPTESGWLGVDGIMQAINDNPVHSANDAMKLLRSLIAANGRPLRDDLVILAVSVPREPHSEGRVTFEDKTR